MKLLNFEDNAEAEIKVASAILYEQSQGQSLESLARYIRSLPPRERHKVIQTYTKFRKNRRHRPGRAFEMVEYTFEMFTNFGMFRDLHRHRVLTLERQSAFLLNTDMIFRQRLSTWVSIKISKIVCINVMKYII